MQCREARLGSLHQGQPGDELLDADRHARESGCHVVPAAAGGSKASEELGSIFVQTREDLVPQVVEDEVGPGVGGELGKRRPPACGREQVHVDATGRRERLQLCGVEHEVGLLQPHELTGSRQPTHGGRWYVA